MDRWMRRGAVLPGMLTLLTLVGCGEEGPEVLASGQESPGYLVLDGQSLYWGNRGEGAGGVMGLTLEEEDSIQVIDGGSPGILRFAGGRLYWQDSSVGGIRRLSGSGAVETVLEGFTVSSFLVTATHLYWVDGDPTAGTAWRRALEGGEAETLATGLEAPVELALDGADLYILTKGAGGGRGGLHRVPAAGGELETLATGRKAPVDLELIQNGTVYWTELGQTDWDGAVVSLEAGADAPVEQVAHLCRPHALQVREGRLYWLNDDGLVMSMEPGGEPETLVVATCPFDLIVEGGWLYYSEPCLGTVSRVENPY